MKSNQKNVKLGALKKLECAEFNEGVHFLDRKDRFCENLV